MSRLFVFKLLSQSSLYAMCGFFHVFVLVVFSFALFFFFIKDIEKYKNGVCLCILVLVYPGWPLKQSFLNFVSFVA